ncbi:MAG: hypothetical protein ACLFTI_01690 [Anaerolineales bacterium]
MAMDQEALKAYQERWQAVAQVENAQHQRLLLSQRREKTNAIFRMAIALELLPVTNRTAKMAAYERWHQLRMTYLARQQERSK